MTSKKGTDMNRNSINAAAPRNLSPQQMFIALADNHKPLYSFSPECRFDAWKAEALPCVLETLGDIPPAVPAQPQLVAEWQDDGLRKQKWLIDVGEYISASCSINYPADCDEQHPRPAIFCSHGHGQFGKEPVMGNHGGSSDIIADINKMNYNYGHQMAQGGFVTFAIDWLGFGERNDCNKPNHHAHPGRDWCNLYYLHATMLGMTSLGINLAHGRAAIDFVTALPEVDESKIGIMGLSGGGTMALWMSLFDQRIKATEIICYSDLWAHFGIRDLNYCGMQIAPGLFKLVDVPDLQGLLAPQPLLINIGANDSCFKIDTAIQCFRKLETIYAAAEASDRLQLDLHPGGHAWGGNYSQQFFEKFLNQ